MSINRADSNWPESETHELSAAEPEYVHFWFAATEYRTLDGITAEAADSGKWRKTGSLRILKLAKDAFEQSRSR